MPRLWTLLALTAFATQSLAQDQAAPGLSTANLAASGSGTPGGVARLVMAHQLYALGLGSKDPLSVLNAARLAASVTLADTPRAHDSTAEPLVTSAHRPVTPAQMLATATTLAPGNEAVLDLIEASRRELAFVPPTVIVSTASALAPAQTETWPLPFYGASLAEVAILTDAATPLGLAIADDAGNPVCQDISPTATAYCSFYPAQNGTFVITVTNAGLTTAPYLLLSN